MAERGLSGSTGGSGGAPNGLTEVDLGPGVSAVFTTAAFDLADAAGRAALAAALGRPLVFANQVHGARLEWIDSLASGRPTCDALASGEHGIGLVIRTADCVPVLLADVDAGIVAAAHAGWRGLLGGVLDAAVGGLRQRGARRIGAAIGPAICGDCYVVGEDLAARAAGAGHVTRLGADGAPRLDLPESARRRLERLGVAVVAGARECTATAAELFSWRARRDAGRQGAVIALA